MALLSIKMYPYYNYNISHDHEKLFDLFVISNVIVTFFQAYGRDLAEASEWCKKFQSTTNVKDLTQAWELYYHVFRRISKQLPQVL